VWGSVLFRRDGSFGWTIPCSLAFIPRRARARALASQTASELVTMAFRRADAVHAPSDSFMAYGDDRYITIR
jgi:hypothetical protein